MEEHFGPLIDPESGLLFHFAACVFICLIVHMLQGLSFSLSYGYALFLFLPDPLR